MEIVKEIFDLCAEKGLHFNFSPHVQSVTIFNTDQHFYKSAYYAGSLIDYNCDGKYFVHISELLTFVKNYNNE